MLPTFAAAQRPTPATPAVATAAYGVTELNWDPQIKYSSASLRVTGPNGFVREQDFGTGKPAFTLAGTPGDGRYSFELVFARLADASLKSAFDNATFAEDGSIADPRVAAGLAALRATHSGSFLVVGGKIVRPDLVETTPRRAAARSAASAGGTPTFGLKDVVTADDAIIQGSLCVGLDCVINEAFGFDTIRLKENNTRIKFEDTSTGAGFPTHDWQLTANDSASGGAEKFSIEDITAATIPFTITGSAPSNSIFVDNTGRVGLRTSVPLLDVHVRTSNTPAFRLEQDSSGGFTAQTWDIAGNEANFFIRDVTGGSRLPFRIRPGAPTSSIDINSIGRVGIGTANPTGKLDVLGGVSGGVGALASAAFVIKDAGVAIVKNMKFGVDTSIGANGVGWIQYSAQGVGHADLTLNPAGGNVGIGTAVPAAKLHTTGTVRLAGVTNCASGIVSNANGDLSCLVSSRKFKNVDGALTPVVALANVMALRPQVGSYKETPEEPEHWLIAEEVARVDPALVGRRNGEPYVVKIQGLVTDLVAVIQQQQRRIDALERLMLSREGAAAARRARVNARTR